jgi:hypothetical protein
VTSTGGWQFWSPKRVERVLLTAGTHILRFDFDSDTDKTGWLFSLNYIDVELVALAGVGDGPAPRAFGLAGSYPNPFHPQTTIEYVLPTEAPVRLAIFDASGRQVRVLADKHMPAGKHTAAWDGRNDTGKLLASGIYFVRFEAAGMSQVGKLVLFK